MKKPNPKKQVLAICYHKVLSKKEHKELGDHIKKIGGKGLIDDSLPVFTASDSVAYAGPDGIHKYLKDKCAFEIFIDNCSTNNDNEKGEEADFYFDGKQLWVWAFGKMHTMDEWIKVVQDSYPDEDDSEEAYSIADFEGAIRNAINTALAAGISQSKVNEILQDIYNTEVEASDEED